MARAKEEKGDFLKGGKLWLNAFLNPFFSFSFREKGKRTAFSFCFSKKKTPGKRKKRPGKPFGWFPRTPSIDQSLALDLRRMEVGESTIDFVGADALSARKRSFCCAAVPKGDAQSAETFRVVGSGATDS